MVTSFQTDIIRILLRNGAAVEAKARERQTPLHIASRLGNVDIAVLLLQHGADVRAITADHYNALHIAAKQHNHDVSTNEFMSLAQNRQWVPIG